MKKSVVIFLILNVYIAYSQNALRLNLGYVGSSEITIHDIYRTKCANFSESMPDIDAYILIINDYIEREVARKFDILPTANEVLSLNNHIDSTTQEPDLLVKLKTCFSGDINHYNKIIVEPKIINRKIHHYFAHENNYQKEPVEKANEAYLKAISKEPFQQIAKELGLQFSYDTLSYNFNISDINYPSVYQIAKNLIEGELYSKIVENNVKYSIIALVKAQDKNLIIARIDIVKNSLDNWTKKNMKLNIILHDSEIVKLIKSKHKELWWINFLEHNDVR